MKGKRLNYQTVFYRNKRKTITVSRKVAEEFANLCVKLRLTHSDCMRYLIDVYYKRSREFEEIEKYRAVIRAVVNTSEPVKKKLETMLKMYGLKI